jgi:GH25 family lysozyme M1 (1,4-beta-N-acetylmuramidase)
MVDKYGQTIGKAAPFWDVVSIRAKKQKGSEDWTGDVTLYFRMASLQREGFPKPQSGLTSSFLKVKVTIPKDKPAPVLFEFQRTMSGRSLRQHLMDNQMYYSQVIWRSLDSATITQLLSGFTYENRPILSQVDPLPVTVAGNFLVFRRHLANSQAAADAWTSWLRARDIVIGERTEQLVPLPSGGVFAEAVLGRFNSAERLDITRFWNWQDSPIPITPPEIAAIQAGSRAMAEDLMPSQLSQPVLQVQAAPDEPEPTGMAAILQAIQNGSMFRDMSGLNATIGFAQTALTRAFDAARDAAAQAGENMKTAADIYKSAFGGGGSGTQPKTQTAPGRGASQPTSRNASEAGALINQGRTMDNRETQPTSPNGGSPSGNGTGRGGTGARGPSENAAFEAALGEWPGDGSPYFQQAVALDKNVDMPMGVDVSHREGNVDWERVAATGNVYFAFIKASDGRSNDAKFQANWQQAQEVGLLTGAYHFWRPLISGKTQAQTFIRQVGFHRRGELPVVLDVEDDMKHAEHAADFDGLPVADLEDNIQEFLDTVKAEFGILPMIYTNPEFWKSNKRMNNSKKFADSMLWIANWDPKNEPTLPGGWPTWEFWQLTDSGRVDGINIPVDLSIFNGDLHALQLTAGLSPKSITA